MEAKHTKVTARTREVKQVKPLNVELLREMIKASNNSRLTQDACMILSNSLDDNQMRQIKQWFRHANMHISNKLAQGKRF